MLFLSREPSLLEKGHFYDIYITPSVFALKGLTTLTHYPWDDGPPKLRGIVEEIIDRFGSWSYFGPILHIFDAQWIKF